MSAWRRFRRTLSTNPATAPLRWPLVRRRHRGIGPADAFIACYPRSGSTWLKFLLCDLLSKRTPDFDRINDVVPNVGYHRAAPELIPGGGRLIRTHEPYRKEYRRAIYLVRDPRDVVLSEHRYHTRIGLTRKDLDGFIDDFVRGRVHGFGSWEAHVLSWLRCPLAESGDLVLVAYEGMREQPVATLRTILGFLGALASDARIEAALEESSLQRMRAKEGRSERMRRSAARRDLPFVASGSVGGWRERLCPEQARRIEQGSRAGLEAFGELFSVSSAGSAPLEPALSKD